MARKSKATLIREELEAQLSARNLTGEVYKNQVDTYCRLLKMADALATDVEERGVIVIYNNGGGQSGTKKNESLDELRKTNTQMLTILRELGLRGADIKIEDDADEGL